MNKEDISRQIKDLEKEIGPDFTKELNSLKKKKGGGFFEDLNKEEYLRIVNILKNRRINLGLTQSEIAERAGISVSNISGMESGKQVCSAATLIAYTKAVEIPYSALDDNDNKSSSDILPELYNLLRSLPKDKQNDIAIALRLILK